MIIMTIVMTNQIVSYRNEIMIVIIPLLATSN